MIRWTWFLRSNPSEWFSGTNRAFELIPSSRDVISEWCFLCKHKGWYNYPVQRTLLLGGPLLPFDKVSG